MSITFTPAPAVPMPVITAFAAEAYALSGSLSEIAAERDQNIRVSGGGKDVLLKVCSAEDGPAAADAVAACLRHIANVDPALPVPRIRLSAGGDAVTTLSHGDTHYPVLAMSWLPGEVLGAREATPTFYHHLGTLLARLGRAMRGFIHPAPAASQLVWNMMRAGDFANHASALPVQYQAKAARLLGRFETDMKPRLAKMRSQIIHGDVHPFNVLLNGAGDISGIIDFGDMIHAPLVLDPANAIADCLWDAGNAVSVFDGLLRGYVSVTPLEEAEVDAIVDLVKVRLLSSAVISSLRQQSGVGNTENIASLVRSGLQAFDRIENQAAELKHVCQAAAGFLPARLDNAATAEDMLARRRQAMGPRPMLFYSTPLHIVSAEGMWLTASDGKRYLDCYNNVPHVGHNHPHVVEAVSRQLRRLNTNTRYLTDEAMAYAEALKATLDPSLDTVVFVNSGSEANDVAWRMAKCWTGKHGALCMDFAYHGVTDATDALSPSNYPDGKWHAAHVRLLNAPDSYRGSMDCSLPGAGEAYAALAEQHIADLNTRGLGVAMGIMDMAFMTNGILNAPQGYVTGVAARVRATGGLFVADEVQSGFGRMAPSMWGHQHHGLVPDIVTIGKPAGNGYPIGVLITRAEILDRFVAETGPFFSTFGGGNAACAAGLAVLDVMRNEGLLAQAEAAGNRLRNGIKNLMQHHEIIGDVRGVGLATGVELVSDHARRTPDRATTRVVLDAMRDEGVLIGSDGKLGNVLKIRPPLAFTIQHADLVVTALGRVLRRF